MIPMAYLMHPLHTALVVNYADQLNDLEYAAINGSAIKNAA